MMTYEMTGRPAPDAPFTVLLEHGVGDVFDADLDAETEDLLIKLGALRIVETPRKATTSAKTSKTKARGN